MTFGPQSKEEEAIFALEELRADIQYEMLKRMKHLGLTQAQLAKKMGVSAAWISQLLGDDANLTLESVSKVYLALGIKCQISSTPTESTYFEAIWERVEIPQWADIEQRIVIGRRQAADFLSVVTRPRSMSKFHERATVTTYHKSEICLEAA